MRGRCRRWLVLALGWLALGWLSLGGVRAQPLLPEQAPERGTVLVLIPVQPGRPLFDLFARGVAAEFLRPRPRR